MVAMKKRIRIKVPLSKSLMIIGGLIQDYIIGQVIYLRKFNNLLVIRTSVMEVFSLVPVRSSDGVMKVLLQWASTTLN